MNRLWIVHGGSDSYFAAKDAEDAWKIVQEMNNISMECGMYPTSKVEVICSQDKEQNKHHQDELERREAEGDEFYFIP